MLYQTNDTTGIIEPFRAGDVLLGWGWFLIVLGIISVIILILFTEFKRNERESVRFTILIILIASFSLGFGIDLLLNSSGLY